MLDKKDRDTLTALFESIDDDRDGMIDVNDIGTAYNNKYGVSVSEQDLVRI